MRVIDFQSFDRDPNRRFGIRDFDRAEFFAGVALMRMIFQRGRVRLDATLAMPRI